MSKPIAPPAPQGAGETKRSFMCGVDWQHHIGHDAGGTSLWPTIKALKAEAKCWRQCGIVEVEVRVVRWPVAQSAVLGGKRTRKAKR